MDHQTASKSLDLNQSTDMIEQSTDGTDAQAIASISTKDVLQLTNNWQNSAPTQVLIVPCGQHSQTDPEPSAELLSMWSEDSWEPFNNAVENLINHASSDQTELVILPGAGGRLSDAICTASWSNSHPDVPLLIDPIRWLTPSMLTDLDDHLIRFASICNELPNIWGVVLRSIHLDQDGNIAPSSTGEGLISNELLSRTLETIQTPRQIRCR